MPVVLVTLLCEPFIYPRVSNKRKLDRYSTTRRIDCWVPFTCMYIRMNHLVQYCHNDYSQTSQMFYDSIVCTLYYSNVCSWPAKSRWFNQKDFVARILQPQFKPQFYAFPKISPTRPQLSCATSPNLGKPADPTCRSQALGPGLQCTRPPSW